MTGVSIMLARQKITFFHSFELPNETVHGLSPIQSQRRYADVIFKHSVAGKSVVDIGAWDGFYSFEAERRGASRVLATDHFCWSGRGWGTKDGFDYVHERLNSKVESLDVDVFDLDPKQIGTFDVTMMLGVLYHLPNPFGGLEKAASLTKELLIIETHSDMNDRPEPLMRYYLSAELNGDSSNYWGPNILCLENMLRELHFTKFETWRAPGFSNSGRIIMHAWR